MFPSALFAILLLWTCLIKAGRVAHYCLFYSTMYIRFTTAFHFSISLFGPFRKTRNLAICHTPLPIGSREIYVRVSVSWIFGDSVLVHSGTRRTQFAECTLNKGDCWRNCDIFCVNERHQEYMRGLQIYFLVILGSGMFVVQTFFGNGSQKLGRKGVRFVVLSACQPEWKNQPKCDASRTDKEHSWALGNHRLPSQFWNEMVKNRSQSGEEFPPDLFWM